MNSCCAIFFSKIKFEIGLVGFYLHEIFYHSTQCEFVSFIARALDLGPQVSQWMANCIKITFALLFFSSWKLLYINETKSMVRKINAHISIETPNHLMAKEWKKCITGNSIQCENIDRMLTLNQIQTEP